MPRAIVCLLCLLACAVPGWALKFRVIGTGTSKVLLIYDCKKLQTGNQCQPYENSFVPYIDGVQYEGDPAAFRRALHEPGIREVWIISGGGIVNAAIEMARDLRASGIPIRVPSAATLGFKPDSGFHSKCVSSCTVFFMGGVIRRIDEGATYEVHSASAWSECVDEKTHEICPDVQRIAGKPETELVDEVQREQINARLSALQMMRLFQNTLLLPTGRSPQPDDTATVKNDVRASLLLSPLSGDANLQRDIDRIHAEGRAAVQDVMMRIEREQMASAIHWLDARTDLGYRAAPALEMVRMMYMESIRETSTLSRSELERRGYVTPEIE